VRKVEVVRVPDGYGRDSSPPKHFKIREWPAVRAEKWAWRMAICLKGTTAQIPDDVASLGMVGVAARIINGILAADIDEAKFLPLLDELMECVQIVRKPGTPDPANPGEQLGEPIALEDDIEEPRTVAWLRSEVLRIHINFSIYEGLSALLRAAASSGESTSSLTRTSPPSSG
jgi:hypothetical protein